MNTTFYRQRRIWVTIFAVIVALGATIAHAARIQDLVRIKGHERNVLTGMGIVIGLNGTGDESKDSFVAARPLAELLRNLGNPVPDLEELADGDSYAIVQVTLEVPPTGAFEGDRLNAHVDTLYNASSLEDGRLVTAFLRPPLPDSADLPTLAMANGPVVVEGTNPRSGLVRSGGQMLANLKGSPIASDGTMLLILKRAYAGFPVARRLAEIINAEFEVYDSRGYSNVAQVVDAQSLLLTLPPPYQRDPSAFIAMVMVLQVDTSLLETTARVVINEKQGIIAVTGDVEIGPVAVTHGGLSITTITPEPVPTPADPVVDVDRWAGLSTEQQQGQRATKLVALLAALEQLDVPVNDQIDIIHELKKTGALHAEVVTE